ncbi:MAG TPA: hypothetical protein VGR51_08580 [Thermoplasmata archaeon]|nr:hypothetical protein [Thermoplasmata archaeon]
MSAFDETQTLLSESEANAIAESRNDPATQALATEGTAEVSSPEGAVAKAVPADDVAANKMNIMAHTIVTKDGSLKVEPTPGTRGDAATPGAFPPGTIDAGGPYGGAFTFEGSGVTFTVQSNDPSVIFFRWDFNDDGVFDFPNQAGGGTLGRWSTLTSVTWIFQHSYYGNVQVQGWDGISTIVSFNSGDNLGQGTQPYWYVFPKNSGFEFTPKSTIQATQLGWYQWFNQAPYSGQVRIWDTATSATIASCAPPATTFQWNWCTLASPVTLLVGHNYRIAEHKTVDYYPYWMGFYGPPGTNPPYSPPDPTHITVGAFYYTWSTNFAYPNTNGGNSVIMMIDFQWQETKILPDVASATGHLQIENVVPTVFDMVTAPSPGLEGTPVQLSAKFSDAGLNNTWEYRFKLFDGTDWITTPWLPVSKYDGGANVLFLHTYAGAVNALITAVAAKCGNFCVKIDALDWGPTGENRVPAMSELTPYDVVVVGTNYFVGDTTAMGNRLADYMDLGGNVIVMMGAIDNAFGCLAGICGRFDTDMYAPIPRGYIYGAAGTMGTIYVPGHPLLDGVISVSTNGLAGNIFSVNPGATRIVDWNNGRVLGAVRTNPKVDNGARAVSLNFFPILGYTGGDFAQMVSNAIRWASRQPDPTIKPFPISLDPFSFTFPDDQPTLTSVDDYPAVVEVRDDSDGQLQVQSQSVLYTQNFQNAAECNGAYYFDSTFPPAWESTPNPYGWTCNLDGQFGSRGPNIWYYYNDPLYGTGDGDSYLTTPSFDLTGFTALRYDAYHNWAGDYPSGNSNGYLQASIDGGATFPYELHAFHHNNPGRFAGQLQELSFDVGGQSDVRLRYYYQSNDDWWWFFDNIVITGVVGRVINGLGSANGVVSIANVPPTMAGGFSNALRTEAQALEFGGFRIADPALMEPSEWFAYRFNMDDGSPSDWVYRGSLAPPKLSILIVHTICLGPINGGCNAGGSGQYDQLRNALLGMDLVGQVDGFNFINYPFLPTAPSLSLMMQYDVIIVATNWAYFSYAPFNLARQQVGDRLADYVDSGRGGVLSMMCVYCTSGGNDLFSIRGRYMDDLYGPFKRANYVFPGASGINVLSQGQDHDIMVGVGSDVGSSFIHDGKDPIAVGGNNAAAGTTGVLLAEWAADGNTAVGVKELNNGVHTVHFGGWHAPVGADWRQLVRNMIGFAYGNIPSPKVPTFTHTWGDNGIYTVDISLIDDDMGFVWDFANNEPQQVVPGPGLAHRFVTVAVDNTDPVIQQTLQAFIAAQVCIRISGTAGNTVTANVFIDGSLSSSVSVTRTGSSPNPTDDKCGLLKLDVMALHSVSASLTYIAPMGGSNPTWLVIQPWRSPINPGHGTVTYKYDFGGGSSTVNQPLPNLVSDLVEGGQGAVVDFAASAVDAGSDDLAFLWQFGGAFAAYPDPSTGTCPVTVDPRTCAVAIHVFHDDGTPRTNGVLMGPHFLGFGEPYFDRAANTGRSPGGTTNVNVQDTVQHSFAGGIYYVTLTVLDDDNTRGYTSVQNFGHDGVDMEFLVIYLV